MWAVVPVKDLGGAKARLSPLLTLEERGGFVLAMLEDVLSCLKGVAELSGVLVVTSDEDVRELAQAHGAHILDSRFITGLSATMAHAAASLMGRDATGMIFVPGDVPLITREDVKTLVEAEREAPSVVLAPALRDGGTNAIVCRPPDVISFHFGPGSLDRHMEAAEERGVKARVVSLARIGLDIDEPQDVAALLACAQPTTAGAFLHSRQVLERLPVAQTEMMP